MGGSFVRKGLPVAAVATGLGSPLLTKEGDGGGSSSRGFRFSRFKSAFPILALLIAGCGGGDRAESGRAEFTVVWPESSRLIPEASQSISIQLLRNGTPVTARIIPRPAGGGPASSTFFDLPVGPLTALATAHPQANGTGVAQAQGSVAFTVAAGQTVPFTLTMASTIDRIELNPPSVTLNSGQTQQLTVSARNAANEIVLISPNKLLWRSLNTNVATLDASGLVTAQNPGTAQITVRETESDRSAIAIVDVAPLQIADDFNDNAANPNLWEIVAIGTGPTVAETNQQLEVTIPASAVGFFFGYKSRCLLRGDFDYQVDYRLLAWPATSGVRMGLWFGNIADRHWANVHRVSLAPFEFGSDPRDSDTGTHFIGVGQNDLYTRIATTETGGRLRLKRVNGVFTSYRWNAAEGQWQVLITGGSVTIDGSIGILAWSDNTAFQDKNVKVAFDNFVLTQGQTVCP